MPDFVPMGLNRRPKVENVSERIVEIVKCLLKLQSYEIWRLKDQPVYLETVSS